MISTIGQEFVRTQRMSSQVHILSFSFFLLVTKEAAGTCQIPGNHMTFTKKGSYCYYLSNLGYNSWRNFYDAKSACEKINTTLVSIRSREELESISDLIRCQANCGIDDPDHNFWLGLVKQYPSSASSLEERRRDWRWLDGGPYRWTNWYEGDRDFLPQPSGRSGTATLSYRGDWRDSDSSSSFRYICKKSLVPEVFLPLPPVTPPPPSPSPGERSQSSPTSSTPIPSPSSLSVPGPSSSPPDSGVPTTTRHKGGIHGNADITTLKAAVSSGDVTKDGVTQRSPVKSDKSGLAMTEYAGIGVGLIFVIAAVLAAVLVFVIRKKKTGTMKKEPLEVEKVENSESADDILVFGMKQPKPEKKAPPVTYENVQDAKDKDSKDRHSRPLPSPPISHQTNLKTNTYEKLPAEKRPQSIELVHWGTKGKQKIFLSPKDENIIIAVDDPIYSSVR